MSRWALAKLGSLRARLAVTYALVVLVSVTAAALYTTAVLRELTVNLIGHQLLAQTKLVADDLRTSMSRGEYDVALAHITRIDPFTSARFLVVDRQGSPVAATTDPPPIEPRPSDERLAAALRGETNSSTAIDRQTPNERVQATVPVTDADGRVVGAVRGSFTLEEVSMVVGQVNRAAVVGAAVAGAIAGALGLLLALSVARPVREVAQAAGALAAGRSTEPLPEPRAAPNEVRSLVRSFNDLAAQLAAFERGRGEFASDVSHELHSLASAMKTGAEALGRGVLKEDPVLGEQLLHGLVGHTHRLSRLAEDLLGLARLEGGRLRLALEDVDLGDVVWTVHDEWVAEADQRGIVLDVDTPGGALPVHADPVRLVQALGNLVENGLKYAGAGGRIDVHVRRADDAYEVAVQDSGPGIPDEARARVFERYFRVEGRLGQGPGGMGLGLAIARGIANAHGGDLSIEAPARGGARFVLRLPRATQPASAAPADSPDAVATGSRAR